MPAESQEPEPGHNNPSKAAEIDAISLDSTNFKEAVENSKVLPKANLTGSANPDTREDPKNLIGTVPIGDPVLYDQYNVEVNKVPMQAPYLENAQIDTPPDLVRERAVDPEDVKNSFKEEAFKLEPVQDKIAHPVDLQNTAKLVYSKNK